MMHLGGAESTLFWFAAPLAVLGALSLLFARKAVHAAMGMAMTMIILGILYITQEAAFLGIIQIFVYSGAVMMLFLFVIMLVGVDSSDSMIETIRGQRVAGLLFGLAMMLLTVAGVAKTTFPPSHGLAAVNKSGNVSGLANLIFGKYVWSFEVTSALLITAALGAMMLAHRERLRPRPTQADWSRHRVREGVNVAGLPAPGVYARNNAVDTPALLPDGSISELSVSRVLKARGQVTSTQTLTTTASQLERESGEQTGQEEGDQR